MASKADIKKSPIDFIYCWADNNLLALVSQYLGASHAITIRNKKARQQKVLAGAYGGSNTIDYNEVAGWIKDQYGYTPSAILVKLLMGESVAGKNWKAGVFGIGKNPVTVYKENPNVYVDTETGKLLNSADDNVISGGTPIYANNGSGNTYISGYSYQLDGKSYTTLLNSDGKYYASTYGNSEGLFDAFGNTYTGSNASSVWENIQTSLPFVSQFLEWVLSVLKQLGIVKDSTTLLKADNVVPKQSEFCDPNPSSTLSLSSFGIMGVALLGGMLLLSSGRENSKGDKN